MKDTGDGQTQKALNTKKETVIYLDIHIEMQVYLLTDINIYKTVTYNGIYSRKHTEITYTKDMYVQTTDL